MQFLKMEKAYHFPLTFMFGCITFIRKCLFKVLSVGPIPSHVAFIMDGNRRYAKKKNLQQRDGYGPGAWALAYILLYCSELDIKYVTVYAFSIDNFRRKPDEIGKIMELMMDSVVVFGRLAKYLPMRIHFAGNLQLLGPELCDAAIKLMETTAHCSNFVLTVCVAYTSTDEILHAVQRSCQRHVELIEDGGLMELVNLEDIEKHMYTAVAPDADIIIRTAGEQRLSNFLLWQSCRTCLSSLLPCWPEFGMWHLVWAILNYQRNYPYLVKKKNM